MGDKLHGRYAPLFLTDRYKDKQSFKVAERLFMAYSKAAVREYKAKNENTYIHTEKGLEATLSIDTFAPVPYSIKNFIAEAMDVMYPGFSDFIMIPVMEAFIVIPTIDFNESSCDIDQNFIKQFVEFCYNEIEFESGQDIEEYIDLCLKLFYTTIAMFGKVDGMEGWDDDEEEEDDEDWDSFQLTYNE